ncbi:MAG: flagellin FliC [Magnetococcales bacterium]|nr:flagellin FliC [Magnetococcales bacterium]
MALSINSNISSIIAQRNLNRNTNALGETYRRLSSGLRVNSAADDAAGLAISNRVTAQIRGINQAVRNANDAVSMMQVAESALEETGNALQRIRELAVEAANSTYTSEDRNSLQVELNALLDEIERIKTDTQFNNQYLLAGSMNGKRIQVGAYSGQYISVTIASAGKSALGVELAVVSGATWSKAASTITLMDGALTSVSDIRANLGVMQTRFESAIANLETVGTQLTAARSRILDADMATETADLVRRSILQQAGVAVLAQANQQPQSILKLLG